MENTFEFNETQSRYTIECTGKEEWLVHDKHAADVTITRGPGPNFIYKSTSPFYPDLELFERIDIRNLFCSTQFIIEPRTEDTRWEVYRPNNYFLLGTIRFKDDNFTYDGRKITDDEFNTLMNQFMSYWAF